jgi:hypothetical protein
MEFGGVVRSSWRHDDTVQHHKSEDSVGHPKFRNQDATTDSEFHLSGPAGAVLVRLEMGI